MPLAKPLSKFLTKLKADFASSDHYYNAVRTFDAVLTVIKAASVIFS